MASVNDCLVQLQKLTQQNLEILQAINDAFLSNQNHLSVKVGDTSYAIPSFISLENKINNLQDNFENLINAPKTGEAYFNLDGNSRAIEVRSYTHTPNSLKLKTPESFGIQDNDIFKDFLTPIPYVNFDLKSLPNDITSVNVKKVIPKSSALLSEFVSRLENKSASEQSWADLYKILSLYKENTDYIEYDVVKKLPIRKNIGSGTYVIEKIISDVIDENLDEYITIKLRSDVSNTYSNKLSYKLFNETIEKLLQVGDQLVTFDDSAKMEITEISHNTNTIQVKVLNGEYLNLISDTESEEEHINDLAKIKFYSPVDFDNDKYINIPLEEDQYVFIAIAPLNDRMNIQAPWGSGVIIDTYKLTNGDISFKEYYQENVRNVGDALYELTAMSSGSLSKLSREDFGTLINTQAELDIDNMKVVQINTHLNDSVTVKNIRALYSQKKRYNTELSEIQTKIDDINSKLASVSFDDTSNLRTVYTAQLTEYNKTKNELVTSLTKIIDEISISANNSDIPIENAKYHIRGFYKLSDEDNLNVRGIKVQYRYKNLDNTYGKATTIKDDFLFSDWNEVNNYRPKVATYGNIGYEFGLQENTDKQNTPSFNQIDIPISQGETVDIRVKKIYDYGYPYVEITSGWSEVINIEFPKEYLKDVQILDIITENNSDIETNRFENILREAGIPDHIGDKIQDQDITYFHKPENISSGFYTPERRIVPLKDKLAELSNLVTLLQDEVLGTSADSLDVSINIGDISNKILPLQDNIINVEPYNSFNFPENENKNENENENGTDTVLTDTSGVYTIDSNRIVYAPINITLTNPTQHTLKLYSIFPGSRETILNDLISFKYNLSDYIVGDSEGNTLYEIWNKVVNLSNIVGDTNNGLVKDVEDLKNTVGDTNNGLVKDVEDLKNTVGGSGEGTGGSGDTGDNQTILDRLTTLENSVDGLETRVGNNENDIYIIKNHTGIPIVIDNAYIEPNSTINDDKYNFNIILKAKSDEIIKLQCTYVHDGIKNLADLSGKKWSDGGEGTTVTLHVKVKNDQSEEYIQIKNASCQIDFIFGNPFEEQKHLISVSINCVYNNGEVGYKYFDYTKDIYENTTSSASIESYSTKSTDLELYELNPQENSKGGVWINTIDGKILQSANQFIYFRTRDVYDGNTYYKNVKEFNINNVISAFKDHITLRENTDANGAALYPNITNKYGLCLKSDTKNSYLQINPGESVVIPLVFEYKLDTNDQTSIQKTMSFDLRTSLYNDPINYIFTVIAKKDATIQDTVLNTNRKYINDIKYSTTVVK